MKSTQALSRVLPCFVTFLFNISTYTTLKLITPICYFVYYPITVSQHTFAFFQQKVCEIDPRLSEGEKLSFVVDENLELRQ